MLGHPINLWCIGAGGMELLCAHPHTGRSSKTGRQAHLPKYRLIKKMPTRPPQRSPFRRSGHTHTASREFFPVHSRDPRSKTVSTRCATHGEKNPGQELTEQAGQDTRPKKWISTCPPGTWPADETAARRQEPTPNTCMCVCVHARAWK